MGAVRLLMVLRMRKWAQRQCLTMKADSSVNVNNITRFALVIETELVVLLDSVDGPEGST